MQAAEKLVGEILKRDEPVYGVNTGFGDLSTVRIPAADVRALQRNLVRSHAVGVGDPLPIDAVRAVMLLRANTLAAGRSGVRRELLDLLVDMVNRGVHRGTEASAHRATSRRSRTSRSCSSARAKRSTTASARARPTP